MINCLDSEQNRDHYFRAFVEISMRYFSVELILLSSLLAHGQPCVIVKRHVHKFGENMSRFHAHRPLDYVEGEYPSGFKWRSELSDGQVRELQERGGRVIIMRPDYQLPDLEDARKQCKQENVH